MRFRRRLVPVLLIFLLVASACSASDWPKEHRGRERLTKDIKSFSEQELGYNSTESYTTFAKDGTAETRCYAAPLFEVVYRNSENFIRWTGQNGICDLETLYESWEIESRQVIAWADSKSDSAMTPAIVGTSTHRFIELILHEEFHDQTWGFSSPLLMEGTATLIGVVGAEMFACDYFGPDTDECVSAKLTSAGWLDKTSLTLQLADDLKELYADVLHGVIGEEVALAKKADLFSTYNRTWRARRGEYGYSGEWAGINTNALLGDTLTYMQYAPLLQDLYLAFGQDIGETSRYLIELSGNARWLEEAALVLLIQEKIQELQEGS